MIIVMSNGFIVGWCQQSLSALLYGDTYHLRLVSYDP